jgi:hypothetical protein
MEYKKLYANINHRITVNLFNDIVKKKRICYYFKKEYHLLE